MLAQEQAGVIVLGEKRVIFAWFNTKPVLTTKYCVPAKNH